MANDEWRSVVEKQAEIELLNPQTLLREPPIAIHGVLGKGCARVAAITAEDVENLVSGSPSGVPLRAMLDDPDQSILESNYMDGTLRSEEAKLAVHVCQNPTIPTYGVEKGDQDGDAGRKQEWYNYMLFAIDLPNPIESEGAGTISLTLGNKPGNPIKVRARIDGNWGDRLPLEYEVLEDEVELWPWDEVNLKFMDECPFGGPAKPLAFIRKENDKTNVIKAWRREGIEMMELGVTDE